MNEQILADVQINRPILLSSTKYENELTCTKLIKPAFFL